MKGLQGFLPDFWDWQELFWVVGFTFTLHIGVLGTLGTVLVLIEHYGLFQDAKIQSQSNVKTHRDPTLWQCVSHLCVLHTIELLSLPVFYVVIKWREMPLEGPLPPWPEVVLQLPLFYLIEDAAFYWVHRLLHTRLLYKKIHKFHHRFHKPIELLLGNSLPLLLGPVLLKAHIKTLWLWFTVRLVEAVDGHSGYDFWFMPYRYFPFRPGADVHDFHHSHNVGNYGSFFLFWDTICGTDLPYRNYLKKKQHENHSS